MKLSVRGLTKIYHTESEGALALSDISISFPETGFVVITGESGSGKTTLLNVLSGFTSYEEGDYFIDDVSFLSYSNSELEEFRKNDIGFIFQDYHLIEDYTVIDNLIVSLLAVGVSYKEAKDHSLNMLKKFGLEDKKTDLVRNLSGGQKQKIAIARALVKSPAIVMCDEPTANLDEENGIIVFDILKEYSKDHLVIITTHNYEDAKSYATELIRLYHGKLTVHNTISEQQTHTYQKEEQRTDYLPLSFIDLKNHKRRTVFKVSFLGIFVAIIVFLLTLFNANIDDTWTKVMSHSVFNNMNETEVLIMKNDYAPLSDEDLEPLRNDKHILSTQLYGHATEMNYYYRENIDFSNNVVIDYSATGHGGLSENGKTVFSPLNNDLFVKNYVSFVNENDLIDGVLPIQYNEVVANSNYHIGDKITVYFRDQAVHNFSVFSLDFIVSGIYRHSDVNLYFSSLFTKGFDFLEYYGTKSPFNLHLDMINTITKEKSDVNINLSPIYNPSLPDDAISFSSYLVMTMPTLFNPDIEVTKATTSVFDNAVDIDYSKTEITNRLPAKYIFVGKNAFESFVNSYSSNTGRAYLDAYSYMDEAIRSIEGYGYSCLSAYRTGSTDYDSTKQTQRAIILILSLVLVFLTAFVYFIFDYLIERKKQNTDRTLSLLGVSITNIKKTSAITIGCSFLLSLAIGIGLYFALAMALQIPFVQNINTYFRPHHLLIVTGIILLASLLVWFRYSHRLSILVKGGKK